MAIYTFFFYWYADTRDLHSFPTRRSSDLARDALFRQLRHRQAELLRRALPPDLYRGAGARARAADEPRQIARALDRLAVERDDDVARLDAGLLRRAALLHRVDERAARAVEAERGGELARYLLDDDADAPARHAALVLQLLQDIDRHIGRNGERQAHEAAGAAIDLRVDADHLAAQVEKRPARVARVDGDVRLDERHEILLRQRAPLGADDAGRHRVLEVERRADRHHPFPDLELRRVAEANRRQS